MHACRTIPVQIVKKAGSQQGNEENEGSQWDDVEEEKKKKKKKKSVGGRMSTAAMRFVYAIAYHDSIERCGGMEYVGLI